MYLGTGFVINYVVCLTFHYVEVALIAILDRAVQKVCLHLRLKTKLSIYKLSFHVSEITVSSPLLVFGSECRLFCRGHHQHDPHTALLWQVGTTISNQWRYAHYDLLDLGLVGLSRVRHDLSYCSHSGTRSKRKQMLDNF